MPIATLEEPERRADTRHLLAHDANTELQSTPPVSYLTQRGGTR
jgi:hypothetical protein